MQTDVSPVGCEYNGRLATGEVPRTEGGIELFEQAVDGSGVPTGIAEFEGITPPGRQRFKKIIEAIKVTFPKGRELEDDRSELSSERSEVIEVAVKRDLRILQLFHV